MLLRCNPKCKMSDGTTEGLLDPDSNEVVCTECGDLLKNVSEFTKRSMKSQGKILKKAKKAFVFNCKTCEKDVETVIHNNNLKGSGCNKECGFSVSKFMINSMKNVVIAEDKNEEKES